MELKFRDLLPAEVDARIGTVKDSGVSLLLYKDARVDMNILDETVGAMNWQKRYSRENANCIVSIWDEDKKQWIDKEDTGTESNTEKEKGLASDSFKRACFNWGIGRELYTAPRIWISGATKNDKFWVKDMTVENRTITSLTICACDQYGNKTDTVAYQYPRGNTSSKTKKAVKTEYKAVEVIGADQAEAIKSILEETNSDTKRFLQNFGVASVEEITTDDYPKAQRLLQKKLEDIERGAV